MCISNAPANSIGITNAEELTVFDVRRVKPSPVQSGSLARPKWEFGPSKVGVWTALSSTARPC